MAEIPLRHKEIVYNLLKKQFVHHGVELNTQDAQFLRQVIVDVAKDQEQMGKDSLQKTLGAMMIKEVRAVFLWQRFGINEIQRIGDAEGEQRKEKFRELFEDVKVLIQKEQENRESEDQGSISRK